MYSNPISTTYTVKNKNNEIVKHSNFSFKFYLCKARLFLLFGNDIFFGEYDVLKNTSYYTGKEDSVLNNDGSPYF